MSMEVMLFSRTTWSKDSVLRTLSICWLTGSLPLFCHFCCAGLEWSTASSTSSWSWMGRPCPLVSVENIQMLHSSSPSLNMMEEQQNDPLWPGKNLELEIWKKWQNVAVEERTGCEGRFLLCLPLWRVNQNISPVTPRGSGCLNTVDLP